MKELIQYIKIIHNIAVDNIATITPFFSFLDTSCAKSMFSSSEIVYLPNLGTTYFSVITIPK